MSETGAARDYAWAFKCLLQQQGSMAKGSAKMQLLVKTARSRIDAFVRLPEFKRVGLTEDSQSAPQSSSSGIGSGNWVRTPSQSAPQSSSSGVGSGNWVRTPKVGAKSSAIRVKRGASTPTVAKKVIKFAMKRFRLSAKTSAVKKSPEDIETASSVKAAKQEPDQPRRWKRLLHGKKKLVHVCTNAKAAQLGSATSKAKQVGKTYKAFKVKRDAGRARKEVVSLASPQKSNAQISPETSPEARALSKSVGPSATGRIAPSKQSTLAFHSVHKPTEVLVGSAVESAIQATTTPPKVKRSAANPLSTSKSSEKPLFWTGLDILDRVVAHSLINSADLNGLHGTVTGYKADRVIVTFDDVFAGERALKPSSLKILPVVADDTKSAHDVLLQSGGSREATKQPKAEKKQQKETTKSNAYDALKIELARKKLKFNTSDGQSLAASIVWAKEEEEESKEEPKDPCVGAAVNFKGFHGCTVAKVLGDGWIDVEVPELGHYKADRDTWSLKLELCEESEPDAIQDIAEQRLPAMPLVRAGA